MTAGSTPTKARLPVKGQRGTERRLPLSEAEIVAAALGLIEEVGVDGLTMRDLSARLGVALGATYKHVPNKDALLRLAAAELYANVAQLAPGGPDDDGIARVRQLLVSLQAIMSRYPGMTAYLATHTEGKATEGTAALSLGMAMSTALVDAGIKPADAEQVMTALYYFVSGALLSPLSSVAPGLRSAEQDAEAFSAGLDLLLDGIRAHYGLTSSRRRSAR